MYTFTAKQSFATEAHCLHGNAGGLPIAFLPMSTKIAIQTKNTNLPLAHGDLSFSGSVGKVNEYSLREFYISTFFADTLQHGAEANKD